MSFDRVEDIPAALVESIRTDGNPRRFELDSREIDDHATMWLAVIDECVASSVFTRRGEHFANWFVPLRPEDVVVFRLRTHPAHRGKGLAASLMRHAIHQTLAPGAHAYIDCRTYNKPSIRCIEKTGFVRIAKMKTIRREWALEGTGPKHPGRQGPMQREANRVVHT